MDEGSPSFEALASEKASGRLHKAFNQKHARLLVLVCVCEQEASYPSEARTIIHHLNKTTVRTCRHGGMALKTLGRIWVRRHQEQNKPIGPFQWKAERRRRDARNVAHRLRLTTTHPSFPPLLPSFLSPFPCLPAPPLSSLTLLFVLLIGRES